MIAAKLSAKMKTPMQVEEQTQYLDFCWLVGFGLAHNKANKVLLLSGLLLFWIPMQALHQLPPLQWEATESPLAY